MLFWITEGIKSSILYGFLYQLLQNEKNIYAPLWALQMGYSTWLPMSLSAEAITARSMLALGGVVSQESRFETRLRLCLVSKILNVFGKCCCGMLAVLSFLCLWGDSVPQTDLFGVGIHTFTPPGIFGLQTFPDFPTPCQNEMSGRKGGVWCESSHFKPLKGTLFVWVHSKGGFPLPQQRRQPCLWCGSCSARRCRVCERDRAAGESCNL